MTRESVEAIAKAGEGKLAFAKKHTGRYLSRAVIAGFFIVVGTVISNLCGVWFAEESIGTAKLLSAASFSAALILIVLLGGELFTGANFVMGVSLYERKVSPLGVLGVWALCYIGNLLGIMFICWLIAASGASSELLAKQVTACLPGKLGASWQLLILKGALCNFLVCTGVYSGFKLKSESGKIIVITLVITTFILAGFEHSIANMATFSLAVFLIPGADISAMLYNLLWVTLGNILGGAVLLGLPLWLSAEPKK